MDKGDYVRAFDILGDVIPDIIPDPAMSTDGTPNSIFEIFENNDTPVEDSSTEHSGWTYVPDPKDPLNECIT